MTRGCTPATAALTIRARGVNRQRRTASSDATTSAQAPSFSPVALPAVTVPASRTRPFSRANPSAVVSGRGCSSRQTTSGSPFARGTVTGTISCASRPSAIAAAARCWLRRANAS
jgi:hypothetical protein